MASDNHYEILVLGGGEAGKYLAWTMSAAGHRTAVVERGLIGGSCPNVACLPSKNIIHSAKVASLAGRGAEFGLDGETTVDMAAVQRRKRAMVDGLIAMNQGRYDSSGTELILGEGRFTGPKTITVALNGGGERVLTGDRVFINTGSRPVIPNIPGLVDARPMTNVELLNLDHAPDHLVILGGGYIGLEFAQAMRRLGRRVTVIEHGPQLAGREDADVAEAILQLFRDEGIDVILGVSVAGVEGMSGESVTVRLTSDEGARTVTGSHLLAATGRAPNSDGIGLDVAGVEVGPRGFIQVNDRLETTAEGVWAMGDCAGSPMFTHVAYDDFRLVHANLSGGGKSTKDRLVPFVMFTDPELARVGMNENEARSKGVSYRLSKLPVSGILRSRTISEPRGFLKALIAKDTDRILGFTAFGAEAGELLSAVQTAMVAGMPYTALGEVIFTHPTMSEGLVFLFGKPPV